MLTGFAIGVASCMIFALAIFVWLRSANSDKNKIAKMQLNTKRLQLAISELLARVNELDQESKFQGASLQPDLSQRLAKACEDLVLLGDAVNLIESRISRQELGTAREDLLISLGAANKITLEIGEIGQEIRRRRLLG